jgi:hypothetical protein
VSPKEKYYAAAPGRRLKEIRIRRSAVTYELVEKGAQIVHMSRRKQVRLEH